MRNEVMDAAAENVGLRCANPTYAANWLTVRLKEITSMLGDGLHGTPDYDENGDYYFINGNNLINGRIEINEKTKRASDAEYQKFKKELNYRTIFFSINGTLGKVALYNGEKVILGKSACYFNVLDGVDKQFIRYILTSEKFQNYIDTFATGSTIKNVSLKLMRDFSFELPVLDEQKKISQILKALDDRIALLRETNATLEAIAQALFKSWFVDFDPVHVNADLLPSPSGRGDGGNVSSSPHPSFLPEGEGVVLPPEIAALFPDSFEASELGLVPSGWQVTTLADAFEMNPTRTLKKGSIAPYLDMAKLATCGHCVETPIQREMGSGTKFRNGDTLLARITPCLENGKSAFVDFLADDQIGWGSTEFLVLRPKAPFPEYFGYLLCRHPVFRDYAIQSMSGTSGRQRIQNDVLGRYLLALPSDEVASTFANIVGPIQKSIDANHQTAQTLTTLRDTLLPRLISGQLRLPDAEALTQPHS